jgi:hypothetical protein
MRAFFSPQRRKGAKMRKGNMVFLCGTLRRCVFAVKTESLGSDKTKRQTYISFRKGFYA